MMYINNSTRMRYIRMSLRLFTKKLNYWKGIKILANGNRRGKAFMNKD